MTLPDQLLIPVGRCKPDIEVTAEHVAQMGRDERLAIVPLHDKGEGALGWFTPEARADGLWATKIETTETGRFLEGAFTMTHFWLAAVFCLDGRDETGTPVAKCYEAALLAGRPPWKDTP